MRQHLLVPRPFLRGRGKSAWAPLLADRSHTRTHLVISRNISVHVSAQAVFSLPPVKNGLGTRLVRIRRKRKAPGAIQLIIASVRVTAHACVRTRRHRNYQRVGRLSMYRDGADTPRPPYIGNACTRPNATFVSLFSRLTVVLKCFCT